MKETIKRTFNNMMGAAAGLAVGLSNKIFVAQCGLDLKGSVTLPSGNVDPEEKMKKVLNLLFTVGRYVGAGLFIWGLIQFAFAIKNDDPDSKQKSIMVMVGGLLAFSVKFIYNAIVG